MPKKNTETDLVIMGEIVDETPAGAVAVYDHDLADQMLAFAGQVANESTARKTFEDYLSRRPENTIRRQRGDLSLFFLFWGCYVADANGIALDDCMGNVAERLKDKSIIEGGDNLQHYPDAWKHVTAGVVSEFVEWMQKQGYAIGSINVRLATVKKYIKLAKKAGVVSKDVLNDVRDVGGINVSDGHNIDEKRPVTRKINPTTGKPVKKSTHPELSNEQMEALKTHPDTPQGRRDAVIMCLFLEHGLRCGELAGLTVENFNLKARTVTFYRPKVYKTQTHELYDDTLKALQAYFDSGDAPAAGPLLRGSRKGGKLTAAGMSERAITRRVKDLGERIGIADLSAHDLRHAWATWESREGADPFSLQEAGGWNSLEMPRRYVDTAKIANAGLKRKRSAK